MPPLPGNAPGGGESGSDWLPFVRHALYKVFSTKYEVQSEQCSGPRVNAFLEQFDPVNESDGPL
jgi:hypothetical protein